jgi:putative membrane protein
MYKVALAVSTVCIMSANALWACGDDDTNNTTSGNTSTGGSTAADGGSRVSSNGGSGGATRGSTNAGTGATNGTAQTGTSGANTGSGGTAGRAQTANNAGSSGAGGTTQSASGGRGGAGGNAARAGNGGTGGNAASAGNGGTSGAQSGDAGALELTDAQIASVGVTANQGEVEQNMVALERAQGADARSFAQDMVTMHGAALQRETALAMTLQLTPEDNSVSRMLKQQSDTIVANLRAADQAQFDQIYLQSQVDVHQQVLTLIDSDLLPNAENAQLKAELTNMRATVAMHLEHVRALVSGSESGQQP